MRRLMAVGASVLVGAVIGIGAVRLAPLVDGRWHSLDGTADVSALDLLRRSDHTPVLFIPQSVARDPRAPVRLVLTLPGLGDTGRNMGDPFADSAEANRWLLLAPSPSYDPVGGESLEAADLRVDDQLLALVDRAMRMSPAPVSPGLGVIGFSRGAQQGHRFTLRHSDRVLALASFSAGTYTMPTSQLPYPLGVGTIELWDHGHPFDAAALRRVNVLVGVGALDENPADVVRAWDDVGGTTRVARAASFTRALRDLGVEVRFQLYPKTGHTFTNAMRDDAVALFRQTAARQ